MAMEFEPCNRPVTEISAKMVKALEKTLRDRSAIKVTSGDMTTRAIRRLGERLRHQGRAARVPYNVRTKFIEAERTIYIWAEEFRPVEIGEPFPGVLDDEVEP